MLKMLYFHFTLLLVLMLQETVKATPTGYIQTNHAYAENTDGHELNLNLETNNDNDKSPGARQKRWYNYYGYGFPPVNPIIYSSHGKRDNALNTAVAGVPDDIFLEIYTRLKEISNVIRQPTSPPPPSQFPIFFPVIFIPRLGCHCLPNVPGPQNPQTPDNDTLPAIPDRIGGEDDVDPIKNWGFVTEKTSTPTTTIDDEDYDDDNVRPISFKPIKPSRPLSRPQPPVEHGTSQAGSSSSTTSPGFIPASTFRPATAPPTTTTTTLAPAQRPSNCDSAILSCCHQAQITHECFISKGCVDILKAYRSPCNVSVILGVIDRFQRFYGPRG